MTKPRKLNNGGGVGKVTSSAHAPSSKHDLFIIDHESLRNPIIRDRVFCPVINGEVKGHGLVKRDFSAYPKEMFDPPSDMHLLSDDEAAGIIDTQDIAQTTLWHVRERGANGQRIPALDQNGQGYCWAYSTTACVMLLRAASNQPYVRLSAHAIGCMVKGFRDEGGWCGLSAKFHRERGCPSVQYWPEKSMSRGNDKPETWANAAQHKVTEEWVDLARSVYDQNLTKQQIRTCLLTGTPCALDYGEWSHSIAGIRWRRVEAGSEAPEILNSWTDGWGTNGTGIIRVDWTVDGAVALRVTGGSDN